MFADAFTSAPTSGRRNAPPRATPTLQAAPAFAPDIHLDLAISQNGYEVSVIEESSPLLPKASALVADVYSSSGLDPAATRCWSPAREKTVVAHRSGHVVGTLTVGADTGNGLLADALYRPQLDALRAGGAQLCELTRFAVAPEIESPRLMTTIFTLGFIVGRFILGATDALIEVNPRHVSFYSRRFGYQIAGPTRICPRVSAPAVLMHASLTAAEAEIQRDGGKRYRCSPGLHAMLRDRATTVTTQASPPCTVGQ